MSRLKYESDNRKCLAKFKGFVAGGFSAPNPKPQVRPCPGHLRLDRKKDQLKLKAIWMI